MRKTTLRELADICQGSLKGNPAEVVHDIIIDSRKQANPEGTVFLAINGIRNNGHNIYS